MLYALIDKVLKPSKASNCANGDGIKIEILRICPDQNCPRIALTGKNAFFRDDYKGKVGLSSKLLAKLSVQMVMA